MTAILYGHPFASFVWKPLIALYERNVAFTFRIVDPDHPENQARIAELSPTGQFPALVDGDTEITQSNSVIEYLDLFHGDAAPMVPSNPREALEARMMTNVFDDYVQMPMQRIVGDALRAQGEKDPRGVADAHAMLDRCYAWLDRRLQGRQWAAGARFTIADCAAAPALFYSDWVHPLPIQCPVRIKKATSILQSDVGQVASTPGVQNLQQQIGSQPALALEHSRSFEVKPSLVKFRQVSSSLVQRIPMHGTGRGNSDKLAQ